MSNNIVDRFTSFAPQILSIFLFLAGVMFACHGAQNLLGAFGGMPPGVEMTAEIWTAGIIELVGGSLMAIGLFTRTAAFIASGMMAVAYFKGHAGGGFFPKVNGGELAVLYC